MTYNVPMIRRKPRRSEFLCKRSGCHQLCPKSSGPLRMEIRGLRCLTTLPPDRIQLILWSQHWLLKKTTLLLKRAYYCCRRTPASAYCHNSIFRYKVCLYGKTIDCCATRNVRLTGCLWHFWLKSVYEHYLYIFFLNNKLKWYIIYNNPVSQKIYFLIIEMYVHQWKIEVWIDLNIGKSQSLFNLKCNILVFLIIAVII